MTKKKYEKKIFVVKFISNKRFPQELRSYLNLDNELKRSLLKCTIVKKESKFYLALLNENLGFEAKKNVFRSDRLNRNGGGAAICIKNSLV